MADEQAVETGQFSFSGQKQQPDEGFIEYFEPGQLDQLRASGRLYLLTEGLGGAAAGSIAGRYAIRKILHDFYSSAEPNLETRLLNVIRKTNLDIIERNRRFPERRPMAVTLIAALVYASKLWVANVGDSRVYVAWGKDIERLTEEREPAPKPAGTEEATPSPAKPASRRSQAGLGLEENIPIEIYSRRMFPGDTIVLCSGGLAGYVTEEEIAKSVSDLPPARAAQRLAELPSRRGSRDTVSVSVTRLLAKPVVQAVTPRRPLPAAPDWEMLSRPPVKTSPLEPLPAGLPLPQAAEPPRRRWLAYLAISLLLVVLLAGFLAWRWWPAAEEPDLAAAGPAATEAADNEGEPAANAAASPAASEEPQPTAEVVMERNSPVSPLPTPVVGASTGEVVSSTRLATQGSVQMSSTPTPLPLPTIALPPDCTNKGRFAGDVTVRDGQEFAPGEQFEKTWSVANYGTCPWGPGYTVRFLNGDRIGLESQPVTVRVEPKGTGQISVPMTAPDNSGTYRGSWQLYSPGGEAFGPELFVEIKVVPEAFSPGATTQGTTLYDFVQNAGQAIWSAGDVKYTVTNSPINRDLVIPFPQGIVAVGQAEFGGGLTSPPLVLLTHPHQEQGLIEGSYPVDTPLQPTDTLVAVLGFPKAAVINDDGASFEVAFTPTGGTEQVIFTKLVNYEDSPVSLKQPLSNVLPGQTGTFTVRVRSGPSSSFDWATWIDLRLVRP